MEPLRSDYQMQPLKDMGEYKPVYESDRNHTYNGNLYNNVYVTYEKENQEQEFLLYKLQNIVTVVIVLALIIMDIFGLHVGNIGSPEVFAQIQSSLWSDTLLPLVQRVFQI